MLQITDKAHILYVEPRTHDPIKTQRLMAEAAYLTDKTVPGLLGRAIQWASGVVNGLAGTVSEGYRLRRAYRDLMTLDDHMLADIGISRHEIPHIVAKSADRRVSPADVRILKPAQTPDAPADETERPLAA